MPRLDLAVIAILDVEASSLRRGQSYPIEIGWCLADTGTAESHLIAPLPAWPDWGPEAEAVHGKARQRLLDHSSPALNVAIRTREAFHGRTIYADGPTDQAWLHRLFHDVDRLPAPQLQPFDLLLDAVIRPEVNTPGDWLRLELARAVRQGELIDQADKRANAVAPKTHRAGADARYLCEILFQAMALV